MLKKIWYLMVMSAVVISSFLSAEIEYAIQDIGTLQTHESQAIALNNLGEVLGWYNIDGSKEGKHFFVRELDGSFHELPYKEDGTELDIDWRYLTGNGMAYGTTYNGKLTILYKWDRHNGVVKLGNLPGKEISAINNAGQVLIESVVENENGKSIRRPVIWENGKITKLNGLEGNVGILSEESYGLDMNNMGEVVGKSVVCLNYKNNIYKQPHATKWVNGKAIDFHKTLPNTDSSTAIAINDLGDVLMKNSEDGSTYYIDKNGNIRKVANYLTKINNLGYAYYEGEVVDKENNFITATPFLNPKIQRNNDTIWSKIIHIIKVNDNGEIIAKAKTIYGEQHAMFLTPVKPE